MSQNNMHTVLIGIDHPNRELFGGTLLARYLESLGIRAVLCSTMALGDYHARYRPAAIVWPNAHWDLAWVAEKSFVFVLPSESGNGQPDWIALEHGGTSPKNPIYPQPVDRFFCWGQGMKDTLLATGRWADRQLVVTGSPATDHWLLPKNARPTRPRIGITTTFRIVSNSTPPHKVNMFEQLDAMERFGGEGQYFLPPDHAEGWVFVEASLARVMIGLVRALAVERNELVEIRPHPWELAGRYEYFSGLGDGRVSATKGGTISEWLEKISVLFTFMSASSLDAIVRGVPVVSLRGLLDPDAARKVPHVLRYSYEDMLWQADDMGQALKYAELAAAGKLDPCQDPKGIEQFLRQQFEFPRQATAAERIAAEIKRVLDGDKGPRKFFPSKTGEVRGLRYALVRCAPMAAQGLCLFRYLWNKFFSSGVDFGILYQPWLWRDRRRAGRAADTVIRMQRERGC
jgi:surface carbohydrate biosynthesis protein